jgi:hypothetical protein
MKLKPRAAVTAGLALLVIAPAALASDMGKSRNLKGQSGELVRVTLVSARDNVPGYQLQAGKRLYCLTVTIRNVGHKRFNDAPGNDAVVIIKGGGEANALIATGGSCDTVGLVNLAPGKSRTIKLPFQVRKGSKVTGFEFTPSSGYGQKGSWKIA